MQPEPSKPEQRKKAGRLSKMLLLDCVATIIEFDDACFTLTFDNNSIVVSLDKENYALIKLINQQVSYKATILGGFALEEKKIGQINYMKYFLVNWEDDMSIPELHFRKKPRMVTRKYKMGQKIELGIEGIGQYRVAYRDGVEARFERKDDSGFSFSFSTGFYGSFWKDEDGSYMLKFKGDKLKPGEDDYRSQSKFVVSRSKFTGNMLLILQDDATVELI